MAGPKNVPLLAQRADIALPDLRERLHLLQMRVQQPARLGVDDRADVGGGDRPDRR